MTAHEWIVDVIEAAATLGYRVEAIDWSTSTVRITPQHEHSGETIEIRTLFLSGAYLLSRIRPIIRAGAEVPA
jgi:hypothetical protein